METFKIQKKCEYVPNIEKTACSDLTSKRPLSLKSFGEQQELEETSFCPPVPKCMNL